MNKTFLREVTSPTLYKNKDIIDSRGLLSQQIFGPIKPYTCECGKLTSKSDDGIICDICGVKSTSDESRYNTFAKIKLEVPLLKFSQTHILARSVLKHYKYLIDPSQGSRNLSSQLYLIYNSDIDKLSITNCIEDNIFPLKITGIYTLYIALNTLNEQYDSKEIKKYLSFFYTELLVLPPQVRKSVILNKSATKQTVLVNELDKFYSTIISYQILSRASLSPLSQAQHYIDLLKNYKGKPFTDNNLIEFDNTTYRSQALSDDIYKNRLKQLSGKNGDIRRNFLGKVIDFSSRSVVIPNPQLQTYEIIIPKRTFAILYHLEYLHYLHFKMMQRDLSLTINEQINRFYTLEVNLVKKFDKIDSLDEIEYLDEFIEYFFKEAPLPQRLILLNRQPTLWRYGLLGVQIAGLNNSNVIEVSPLVVNSLGMDFDGDSVDCNIEFKVDNKVIKCHISEFLNYINDYCAISVNSVIINENVQIKSFNVTTGEMEWKPIYNYSIHNNLKMYKLSNPNFETFWASSDSSLIVYDKQLKEYKKCSPEVILLDKERYYLVKIVD